MVDPGNEDYIGFCVDKCPAENGLDYSFYDRDGSTILIDYFYKSYATKPHNNNICMPWTDSAKL